MGKMQFCATPGCESPAAFATRSRPSWCQDCLAAILNEAGLAPVEPLSGSYTTWWLTTCLGCGVHSHHRLEHILEKRAQGHKPCRICDDAEWAAEERERRLGRLPEDHPFRVLNAIMEKLLTQFTPEQIYAMYPTENMRRYLDTHHAVRPGDLTGGPEELKSDGGESNWERLDSGGHVLSQCRGCGRVTVGVVSTPCGCITKGTSKLLPAGQKRGSQLLADSDSELLGWWDHDRNEESIFKTVTLLARRVVHWRCPDCDHRFDKKIADMTRNIGHSRCPECQRRKVEERMRTEEQWAQTPVASVPELAAAWADDTDPAAAMAGDKTLYLFRCEQGHTPRIRPVTFIRNGCPYCTATRNRAGATSLSASYPEIAAQWHPTRNSPRYTPDTVNAGGGRMFWWRADCCGHEWEETAARRCNSVPAWRCPQCRTILGSLAYENPEIAGEWSPTNPKTAWQVSPFAETSFLPEWICSADPTHVWQAPTKNRTSGSGCPQCRETGKSRVELDYCAAAVEVFGDARSGVILRHASFVERTSWSADISVEVAGHPILIEYDGSYWHYDEAQIVGDERKSRDLLGAGYVVVRLREDGLPGLGIDHPYYAELTVYPQAPRPVPVMNEVRDLLRARGLVD